MRELLALLKYFFRATDKFPILDRLTLSPINRTNLYVSCFSYIFTQLRAIANKVSHFIRNLSRCRERGRIKSLAPEVGESKRATESRDAENFPITLPAAHCEKRFRERGNCFGCTPAVECPLVRPHPSAPVQVREVIATPHRQSSNASCVRGN